MTKEEIRELKGLAASMGLYDDKNPCKRAKILGKIIKELEHESSYISIDDVMSVFDDFMCGEVDEEGTEIFFEMLKDKAEMESLVEIVTCKNCKHCRFELVEGIPYYWCNKDNCVTSEDFYCGNAESEDKG